MPWLTRTLIADGLLHYSYNEVAFMALNRNSRWPAPPSHGARSHSLADGPTSKVALDVGEGRVVSALQYCAETTKVPGARSGVSPAGLGSAGSDPSRSNVVRC